MTKPLTSDEVVEWDAPVDLTPLPLDEPVLEVGKDVRRGPQHLPTDSIRTRARSRLSIVWSRPVTNIIILTTKPNFAVDDTHDWLELHGVPTREVHILDDKTTVDCHVYLDDADHQPRVARGPPQPPRASVATSVPGTRRRRARSTSPTGTNSRGRSRPTNSVTEGPDLSTLRTARRVGVD